MCIQTQIERAQAQKAALDALIQKLEQLKTKTAPVKTLLSELLADYSDLASEDLASIWQEILAIGQKFGLSVQPLAADELRQWEATNAENQDLRSKCKKLEEDRDELLIRVSQAQTQYLKVREKEVVPLEALIDSYQSSLTSAEIELASAKKEAALSVNQKHVQEIVNQLQKERDSLEAQLAELRSQMPTPTIRAEYELATGNDASELSETQCQQQLEVWEKEAIRPGLEKLYQEAQAHELEAIDIVESILVYHGFFMPDIKLEACYDPEQKYETYKGWEVYRSCQDKGVDGIGLYNEQYGFWDASTEMIGEDDPTFPQSFTDYDAIVAWTRKVVDKVVAVTPTSVESSEVPGQLALEFSPSESDDEEIPELGGNWEVDSEATDDEPTELQKLLANNCNFTFEDLGVNVAIRSVITEQEIEIDGSEDEDDEPATEEIEEALFTCCNAEGITMQYYHDDVDGLVRVCHRFGVEHRFIRETAEGYAKKFLQDLKKDAEIKEKNARWKADETLASNKSTPEPIAQDTEEPAKPETDTEFEVVGYKVQIYPQYAGENNLVGATFRFLSLGEKGANEKPKLVFSTSLLVAEIRDRNWRTCAYDLIQDYRDKEAARLEKLANPYATEEDKFIELVKLTPAVGYIKRRDNGELISAYAAFANRDAAGEKTETLAKPRAKKWKEFWHSSFESCGWKVEEPQKVKRMQSEPGAKQVFAYEVKITGKFSIGQLQKLAEEDFSLLPNESAPVAITASLPPVEIPAGQIYSLKVNSYKLAEGTEQEMKARFEEELKILGGSQMSVSLLMGSEIVESYRVAHFDFVQVADFDSDNPEYQVTHLPSQSKFRIYRDISSVVGTAAVTPFWRNSVYPYSGFSKREAAAVDAVRRQLKAKKAE